MTDIVGSAQQRVAEILSGRVATLRRRDGLSLDALAERSGLSKGTVVSIERGVANPSIAILCRLAAAFSVSVSDLIEDREETPNRPLIERTVPQTLWTTKAGGAAVLEAAISGETMFELWSWTLGPEDCHVAEGHRPGTAELVVVRKGSLEVRVGDDIVRLGPGEAARLTTDMAHSYRTAGNERTEFVMAVLEKSGTQLGDRSGSN